jgi:hypothetical protein
MKIKIKGEWQDFEFLEQNIIHTPGGMSSFLDIKVFKIYKEDFFCFEAADFGREFEIYLFDKILPAILSFAEIESFFPDSETYYNSNKGYKRYVVSFILKYQDYDIIRGDFKNPLSMGELKVRDFRPGEFNNFSKNSRFDWIDLDEE